MTTTTGSQNTMDPQRLAQSLLTVSAKSQKLVGDYFRRLSSPETFNSLDPWAFSKAFQEMALRLTSNPTLMMSPTAIISEQMKFMEAQLQLWNNTAQLWQRTTERMLFNRPVEPVVKPDSGDKRFQDSQWVENYVFDYIKQAYLLAGGHIQSIVGQVSGLDEHSKRQLVFYTRQWVDAMAPTNFAVSNPQVIRATMESGGENLYQGLVNLLTDIERGNGRLSISMTDYEAFKLGENLAVTPGKVIYQNDLMQLIQYSPSTETVYKRPLMIVPPWINKFYIMDLRPKNSFIKWAIEQGHTVFLISWVNPDEKLSHKTFDDYLLEGPIEALRVIEQVTGEHEVNGLGYCLGGTLLGITKAYLAAKGDSRIASATLFTCMLDFAEAGDLGVFIDEAQLTLLDSHMQKKGFLDGSNMATAFSMLRANDLLWSFVVSNYLMGQKPSAFDILYWNADPTRMTAPMHSFYLRSMYLRNELKKPGGITLAGTPIDLSKITTPMYFLSAREDHIAPWTSTYAGTQLVSGPVTFVLGGSGHIAGVINPPASKKYFYMVNDKNPVDPEEWLATATKNPGSWWDHWANWVSGFAGERVPAREPGCGVLSAIEDAPGAYVKVRIN